MRTAQNTGRVGALEGPGAAEVGGFIMARLTTVPRASMLLLCAGALVSTQAVPVLGEPAGMVSGSAQVTVEPVAAVAAKTEPESKPAAAAGKTNEISNPACKRDSFRIVVDVGHTAGKPGAISARGTYEYDFNLKLATLIDEKLHAAGFAKSTLLITKDTPYYAGLFRRAERARAMSADLFLSIHHDSVPDKFLEKWEYNGRQQFYSDRFKGHSIFISRDNSDYQSSLQFARMLGQQLKERGLKYTPHYTEKFMGHRQRILVDADVGVYRYDQLIVLRSNRVPAVLLEAGSIINRDEELQMASPKRRELISKAAVNAVERFCEARSTQVAHAGQPASSPKVQRAGMLPQTRRSRMKASASRR